MINRIKHWFHFPPGIIPQDDLDVTENNTQASKHDSSSVETTSKDSFSESQTVSQVKDADLEYLFHQLLEGVVNGWQENRIARFLHKLEPKISQQMWLEWLQRYRRMLIASPSPHGKLVARMNLLGSFKSTASEPFVRAIADSVDKISKELLNRRNHLLARQSLGLPSAPETVPLVPEYQIETDNQSLEQKKSPTVLGNILSLLQKNPLLKVNREKIEARQDAVIDPAMIMAQITKDTGSNTQPTLMKESNKPEVQSIPINEDRDVDHPSVLVSETTDLSSQSSVVTEDTEFPAINSNYRLSAEDIFSVALEKAQAGDLEKALSLWQEVVNIEPDFAPAWHNLGSAYAYLNRLTEAIESFDKALAININDHLSWNDRGNALFRLKKWQEAIISWDRVIGIKPDFEQAWYHRGLALEKLEEYAEAMISYKKCLNINPNFKQAQKRYQKLRLNTVIVGAGKREKASVKKRFTNHNWNNSRQEV